MRPRGVLFLCVANSARSQLAEGIARALLPPDIAIWSAGSAPTQVRPEAIAVLAEIGIDASGQRSKSVDDVPRDQIDTVVTLCAGEVCPAYLGRVTLLHWPLPDPAAVTGSIETRIQAFRDARDALRGRIAGLLTSGATPRIATRGGPCCAPEASCTPPVKRTKGTTLLLGLAISATVIAAPLYLKSRQSVSPPTSAAVGAAPSEPLPRFVDAGTTTCAPCKVMLGVMEELERTYSGELVVEFVNTREQPDEAERLGIRTIPSQIFYAPDGRELYRHTGVMRSAEIAAKWAELGFTLTPVASQARHE